MELKELQTHWNEFGKTDPLYAILTHEGKQYNQWSEEEFFASGQTEVNDLMNYIDSLGLEIRLGKALDFGCGVGRLTQALCQRFANVSGVDIAPSMIELANTYNRYESRCHYHLNGNSDLKLFNTNTFDFIYSRITLQHMAPRYSQAYIREFIRILKPDGLLVFQLPDAPTITDKGNLRLQVKSLVPPGLLRAYRKMRYGGLKPVMQMFGVEKSVVVSLLEESGAELIDVRQDAMAEAGWVSHVYVVRKASWRLEATDH